MKKRHLLFVLLPAVLVIYLPSLYNDFVNLDDGYYVYNNPLIRSFSKGLLTEFVVGNYHPLTMISYALEYHFGGVNAGAYHLTNILLHLLNSILAYYFILLLTQSRNTALFASLIFAVHPMHVEPVAWVSGRKDLLYTLFYLLSLIVYLKQAISGNKKMYWLALLFFVLSLLSKAMAVTLPICLLLIDYFLSKGKFHLRTCLKNKLPFFILACLFGILAIKAQSSIGALGGNEVFGWTERLFFATYGIGVYSIKFILPFYLNCYYAYPRQLSRILPVEYYASLLILMIIILVVFWLYKKNRFIVFGVLFFLANVLLVSQIITVGSCVLAERYTYLSYLGLCLIAGYLLEALLTKFPNFKKEILINAMAILLIFSFLSHGRVGVWKNSETLWTDVIQRHPHSAAAYAYRGVHYSKTRQYDKAISDYSKSLELDSRNLKAYENRGLTFFEIGDYDRAIQDFSSVLNLQLYFPKIIFKRAQAYELSGNYQKALDDYNTLLNSKDFGQVAEGRIRSLMSK